LDGACPLSSNHVLSATVWVDGVMLGDVYAGSSITKTVSIGYHNVEATSYSIYFIETAHWAPASTYVGANGGARLMACN
jgi:hypothetical protein